MMEHQVECPPIDRLRPSVLLVDDNDDTREALGVLFATHGLEVVEAGNGAEALAYLRTGYVPSVIVLDIMMPGSDGYAFRQQQLGVPAFAAIPVIIYSGAGRLEERAAELGISTYLAKPAEPDAILEIVAAYLRLTEDARRTARGRLGREVIDTAPR